MTEISGKAPMSPDESGEAPSLHERTLFPTRALLDQWNHGSYEPNASVTEWQKFHSEVDLRVLAQIVGKIISILVDNETFMRQHPEEAKNINGYIASSSTLRVVVSELHNEKSVFHGIITEAEEDLLRSALNMERADGQDAQIIAGPW